MESLHASYNYRKVKLRRTISTMYKLKLKMKNLNKKSLNFENINGYFFFKHKAVFFFFNNFFMELYFLLSGRVHGINSRIQKKN